MDEYNQISGTPRNLVPQTEQNLSNDRKGHLICECHKVDGFLELCKTCTKGNLCQLVSFVLETSTVIITYRRERRLTRTARKKAERMLWVQVQLVESHVVAAAIRSCLLLLNRELLNATATAVFLRVVVLVVCLLLWAAELWDEKSVCTSWLFTISRLEEGT
ncbi:hypothetical protein E3N88_07206 [Mikania micrantha]|uniref:Uncharacterized protein n=1 Tax=Mikania micrantha TaxID=192012 RepID=A0A5N6PT94_9ASTR|nr:hypothetical protein E3N88_07206 [Mikania micrantha]